MAHTKKYEVLKDLKKKKTKQTNDGHKSVLKIVSGFFKTIWFNLLLTSHFSLVGRTLMVLSTTAGSLYKSQFGSLWHLKSTHNIWYINTDKTINKGQAVVNANLITYFEDDLQETRATNLLKYWSFGRRHSFQCFRLFVSDYVLTSLVLFVLFKIWPIV